MEKNDLVHLEYELWIVGDKEELYDTTKEELAKEHEIFDEKKEYHPQALVVGNERVLKGLDKSLMEAEVGKEYVVDIPPEEGAGERNPKLVEVHKLNEFLKQDIEPQVGMEVTFRGKQGYITAVTGGRVRIDFNNRLAGKTIRYKYKILDKAETPEEKINYVIEMNYGKKEGFETTVEDREATILLPDVCKYDQTWFVAKYKIVSDLRAFADLKKISFIEEYVKKEDEEEKGEGKEEGMDEKEGTDEAKDAAKVEEQVKEEPETEEGKE